MSTSQAHHGVSSRPRTIVPPSSTCSLNCLVSGSGLWEIICIKMELSKTVGNLARSIKDLKKSGFGPIPVDPSHLNVWKVNLPMDRLEHELEGFEHANESPLLSDVTLLDIFSCIPNENYLHIVVWCGGGRFQLEGPLDVLERNTEFRKTLWFGEHCIPSDRAKSSRYRAVQSTSDRLYDGRGSDAINTSTAPPIELFHPAFAHFRNKVEDVTLDVPDDILRHVHRLMTTISQIHTKEDDRHVALAPLLGKILAHPFMKLQTRSGRCSPDAVVFSSLADIPLYLIIDEEKNEIGDGGSDPSVQASFSYLNISSAPENTQSRSMTNCPTFIIAHAGPWLAVLGAVLTDKCIIQRLTDLIWIPVHSSLDQRHLRRIGRVLYALRESVALLESWYRVILQGVEPPYEISRPTIHSRFFLSPHAYLRNGTPVEFVYQHSLRQHPSCVTYLARTIEDEPMNIVVKFVNSYGVDVHQAMENVNAAPKLFYHGPIDITEDMPSYDGLKMVVMEHIEGVPADLAQQFPPNFYDDLGDAVRHCHQQGFVFGDLRKSNIMITKDDKVKLVTFDWAGRESEAKYPVSLPPGASWPRGVEGLGLILKAHDLDMLLDPMEVGWDSDDLMQD